MTPYAKILVNRFESMKNQYSEKQILQMFSGAKKAAEGIRPKELSQEILQDYDEAEKILQRLLGGDVGPLK